MMEWNHGSMQEAWLTNGMEWSSLVIWKFVLETFWKRREASFGDFLEAGRPDEARWGLEGSKIKKKWQSLKNTSELDHRRSFFLEKVPKMAPTWPPKRSQNRSKIDPKIDQNFDTFWDRFWKGF